MVSRFWDTICPHDLPVYPGNAEPQGGKLICNMVRSVAHLAGNVDQPFWGAIEKSLRDVNSLSVFDNKAAQVFLTAIGVE